MKTIYKYRLEAKNVQFVVMPKGARILTVQGQRDEAYIWAVVDTDAPDEKRPIFVYGTGHPLPEGDIGTYVGTFQTRDGGLVFHVFEGRP